MRKLGFAGRIAHYFINSKLTPLLMGFSLVLGAFAATAQDKPADDDGPCGIYSLDYSWCINKLRLPRSTCLLTQE